MNTDIQPAGDEEYQMPCAEALLASTLALMTGHAQACCDDHRTLMAARIAGNLAQLAEHALLSPQFKTLLWSLRGRWQEGGQAPPPANVAQRDRRLWHTPPDSVQ
jgi:hypothetical protein